MFEPCSCSPIWDFVCEDIELRKNWREHDCEGGVYIDEAIERDAQAWIELYLKSLRCQALVRHGVLRSPRAGAALSSGGKMTRRALARSTRSTRATPSSLLTGTVVGRKMAGGYTVRRCSTHGATAQDEV